MAYNIKLNGLEIKSKTGENVLASDFSVEIKDLDVKNATFWAVASPETEDRDKDIIRVTGWDLKNYKKAPRGLWMHNYFELPVFKTAQIKADKKEKRLIFQPQFDLNYDKARTVWNQFENGFLSDFSVGFIGKEFNWRNEEDRWNGGREFTNQELLEISAVTIPANPDAQMIRNSNFIPEEVNLLTMGYIPEIKLFEDKNEIWIPVSNNLEAFKDPRIFNIENGVRVVNAVPRYKDSAKGIVGQVVGYYFDTKIFHKEQIENWLNSKNIHFQKNKYYSINFDEEQNEYNILIEEKDMEESKLLTTMDLPDFPTVINELEDNEEMHLELELNPEEECNTGKPKKSEVSEGEDEVEDEEEDEEEDGEKAHSLSEEKVTEEVDEVKSNDPVETFKVIVGEEYLTVYCMNKEDREKLLQFFDKDNTIDVQEIKDVLVELRESINTVKADLNELKSFLNAFEEGINKEHIIEFEDFESESPTETKDAEDMIELPIEFSSNEQKILNEEIPATIGNIFKNIFKDTLKKYSGKIED